MKLAAKVVREHLWHEEPYGWVVRGDVFSLTGVTSVAIVNELHVAK